MDRGALDRYYARELDLCRIWIWVSISKGMSPTLFVCLNGMRICIFNEVSVWLKVCVSISILNLLE